jgi:hypothetical protein
MREINFCSLEFFFVGIERLKNSKFPVASIIKFWFIGGIGFGLVPFSSPELLGRTFNRLKIMRYTIAVIILSVFTGTCFGINCGTGVYTNLYAKPQCSSTNLVKAAKTVAATTNQPPKWDGTFTLGVTAPAGNVDSVLTTAKLVAEKMRSGTSTTWRPTALTVK